MESRLKVSEKFFAGQGEGLYLGVPSVFLRLFGCNRKCPMYGLNHQDLDSKGYNPEVKDVIKNIDNYKNYNELPLVHSGCDTYAAVYSEFKHLSPFKTISEITKEIIELLPGHKFDINKHLILTGGEPLLWQNKFPELLDSLYNNANLSHVTIETNGTIPLTVEFSDYLLNCFSTSKIEITFSVSSKLPCSGHTLEESICPYIVGNYWRVSSNLYFKWVVASKDDVEDVKSAIQLYDEEWRQYEMKTGKVMPRIVDVPIYLMPVGGTTESYLHAHEVRDIAYTNGWRFSPRLQVLMDGNKWAT